MCLLFPALIHVADWFANLQGNAGCMEQLKGATTSS
jgi:hypothetical protein